MNSVAPSFEGEHIGAGEAALLLWLAVVGSVFCVNLLDGHSPSLPLPSFSICFIHKRRDSEETLQT